MSALVEARKNSMHKIEGTGSDDMSFSLELIDSKIWLLSVSGKCLPGDASIIFKGIEKAIPANAQDYLIIDLKGFEKFPIQERKMVFEKYHSFVKEERISFTYLINPNTFIRMVALLVGVVFKDIPFLVESDFDTAFRKSVQSRSITLSKSDLVREAIDTGKSNDFVTVQWKEVIPHPTKKSDYLNLMAFEPNVILIQYHGSIHGDQAEQSIKKMHEHHAKLGKDLVAVIDMEKSTSVDRKSRKLFDEESDNLFGRKISHTYYKFTPLFGVLFKAFTYINKSYAEKTTIINSTFDTLADLFLTIEVQPAYLINELTERTLNQEEINSMDVETLRNYVNAMQQEMHDYRRDNQSRIDNMMSGLSHISWNHDYSTKHLPDLPENDDFHQLFHTVNFIQEDISELVQELRNANTNLEEQVQLRTKEISQKESNLRSIIENFNTPIWLIDNKYRVLEFNSIFENNMRNEYNIQLEKGQNILEIFPDEIAAFWKNRYDICLSGKSKKYLEDYNIGHLGHLHFDVKTFPIFVKDEIKGVGVVAVDITELQRSKVELESKNKRLEKVNKELDSFIYRSSHDLRAPISSVKGLIQIAKMESNPSIKDQYLDKMVKTMDKLDGFIHEIMDITKNEKLEIQSEEVHIGKLIDQVLDELAHSEEVSKIKISKDIGRSPKLISDKNRLKTLLKNIVANSIKYRDENKDSKIEIRTYRNQGNMVIEVEDNGEGIPKESLSQITSMFYRAHPSKSGSGLGLYIVSEILNKISGRLKVESEFNKFTKVTINVPLSTN